MTNERKNEIWATLPSDFKQEVYSLYEKEHMRFSGQCLANQLEYLFGRRNLTAQAEEKPKEPKFKVGDRVLFDKGMGFVLKVNHVEDIYRYFTTDVNGKAYWYDENELTLDPSENIVSDHIVVANEKVNYIQYRLDLAKEIAIALINNTCKDIRYGDVLAYDAVKIANIVVKQLKETEHGDGRTD